MKPTTKEPKQIPPKQKTVGAKPPKSTE